MTALPPASLLYQVAAADLDVRDPLLQHTAS